MSPTKSKLPTLFNPASQSPDELVANFVIRLKEFDELFQAIKSDRMIHPPQHYIIQGQRGYGKSTLLLRLKIAIENDDELKTWLIPVAFGEEQYGVFNLAGLWLEVAEILAEEDDSFSDLAEHIDHLGQTNQPEEDIFNHLTSELKKRGKKIVLILDNFNELIGKFQRKDKQRLREVLITSGDIRLIGASSAILESDYEYKEPFFDFFKAITLNELNREETIRLLAKLGETYGAQEIQTIIKEQPARIDSLRRLTGGVPRTVVLLFEIFIDDVNGNSFKDLETILDRVTPLYKHRLDNLSVQQQAIFDAIALSWDAVSTKEIAAKVKMASKAVSSQLAQLEKNQLIRKIPTSTKNHLYQIRERFFNIYYLMRVGKRKNRNRVLWLVKFFEICCGEKELIDRTTRHIKAMQEGRLYDRHAFFVSEALSKTAIPLEVQHDLLNETKKFLANQNSQYAAEVGQSHIDVYKDVIMLIKNKNIVLARKKLEDDGHGQPDISMILATISRETGDLSEAIRFYKNAIEYDNQDAMFNLAFLYDAEFKDYVKAEEYYKMAVEKGSIAAKNNLSLLYFRMKKNKAEALRLQKTVHEIMKDKNSSNGYIMILFWNDEIPDAAELFELFYNTDDEQKEVNQDIGTILIMFLAKKQFTYLLRLFEKNQYDIKDKYKSIYYALLSLMGERYADELKKMGDELKESVEDVLDAVKQWEYGFSQEET